MNLKEKIAKLPTELRTVANKFDVNRPDSSVPEFIMQRAMGEYAEEEFNMEDLLAALADFIKRDKEKLTRMRKELNELLEVPMMADEIEETE